MVIKLNKFRMTDGKPYFPDSFKILPKVVKELDTLWILCDRPRSYLVIYKPKLHLYIAISSS